MTVHNMTTERVTALIEAYGADSRRWPEVEREAARAMVAARPDAFAAALAEADAVDGLLHASPRPDVSAALRQRVLDAAPKPGRFRFSRPHLGKLGWTLAGGWAAAAFAGAVAGIGLTGELTQTTRADAVLYQASQASSDDLASVYDVEVLG